LKLNLLLDNKNGQLSGFTNIDVMTPDDKDFEDLRVRGDVTPLSWICDNGECEELIARHILCYFPIASIGAILSGWITKIAKGGLITIEETDVELASYALVTGKIDPKEFQRIIYGGQSKKWDVKKSGLTTHTIIDFLEGSGFKILKKRLNDLNFVVQAVRL